MNFKNGEVFQASQSLEILSNKDFPIKVSYGIVTLMKKLSVQTEIIEKLRTDLIKKHGTTDKVGNVSIEAKSPKMVKFAEEFNTLLTQEIDIDFEKVKLPFEVDGKSYNIEPKLLVSLEKFIEME